MHEMLELHVVNFNTSTCCCCLKTSRGPCFFLQRHKMIYARCTDLNCYVHFPNLIWTGVLLDSACFSKAMHLFQIEQ